MHVENITSNSRKVRRDGIRRLSLDELRQCVTISVEEASHLLGISRSTAYEAVKNGTIPAILVGKRRRVLAHQLYAMLTGQPIRA